MSALAEQQRVAARLAIKREGPLLVAYFARADMPSQLDGAVQVGSIHRRLADLDEGRYFDRWKAELHTLACRFELDVANTARALLVEDRWKSR